jgi:hypothetical protein
MKKVLIGCLFWASSVSAQSFTPLDFVSLVFQGIYFSVSESVPSEITVTAQGKGRTQQEAVESALNLSIQKAIGVLIVSDQTVNNDKVVRNLVASYSSGVVNSYNIDTCIKDKIFSCTVTAKVSPWKFMRKLEGDSQTIKVNGSDLHAQAITAKSVLVQRQKLTNYYMSQIRQSGLDVNIREVKIVPSVGEMVELTVDYEVKWNKEFKKEIIRFLEKLEKDTVRDNSNHQVYIQWGPTGFFENRVRINTYDSNFRSMMLHYIHQPVLVRFNELNTCADTGVENVFTVDWYGVRRQKTFRVNPEQLKGMQSISMTTGCSS